MSQPISIRLPEATDRRVRFLARRRQRSVNEVISLAVEEWLRQQEFAFVEFQDTASGRLPYMKNSRLPVYWVIQVVQDYNGDIDPVLAYWPNRSREWVQAALNYYEAYPDEIDTQIQDHKAVSFDSLKRLLPRMQVFTVPADPGATEPGTTEPGTTKRDAAVSAPGALPGSGA